MNILEALRRNRKVYESYVKHDDFTDAGMAQPSQFSREYAPVSNESTAQEAARQSSTFFQRREPETGETVEKFPSPGPQAYSLDRPRALVPADEPPAPAPSPAAARARAPDDPLDALQELLDTRARLGSQLLAEEEFG